MRPGLACCRRSRGAAHRRHKQQHPSAGAASSASFHSNSRRGRAKRAQAYSARPASLSDADAILSIPQWQGADPACRARYLDGGTELAEALSKKFPELQYFSVAVDPEETESGQELCASLGEQQLVAAAMLRAMVPQRCITIGGDCSVEPAPIGYFNEQYDGRMCVLWLDAHGDLNSPQTSASGRYHGMALRGLIEPEFWPGGVEVAPRPLLPSQIVLAGARGGGGPSAPGVIAGLDRTGMQVAPGGSSLDQPEVDFIQQHGLRAVTAASIEMARWPVMAELMAAGLRQKRTKLYVHLDLDVLDPSSFPHVCVPEDGGLSLETLLGLLKGPALNPSGRTLWENPLGEPTGRTHCPFCHLLRLCRLRCQGSIRCSATGWSGSLSPSAHRRPEPLSSSGLMRMQW